MYGKGGLDMVEIRDGHADPDRNNSYSKWPHMIQNGPKMNQYDQKWPKMIQYGPKMAKNDPNDQKWAKNGQKKT